MSQISNVDADEQVAEALSRLREMQQVLSKLPTRDLPFPTPVSHVHDYQNDEANLKRYGVQVIGNRCLHFAMLATVKAYYNLQMYLDGLATKNPLTLPMAARAQIELFAIAWHVYDVIISNAGFTKPELGQRMLKVDEALIMAIHGTRSEDLADIYKNVQLSKLRPTNNRDLETFKAKNILSRIEKTESGSNYQRCGEDYDRLSDLLHPNGSQNLLFMVSSAHGDGWFRMGLFDPSYIRRAQYQTAHAMVNASSEILRLVVGVPDPFIEGVSPIQGG